MKKEERILLAVILFLAIVAIATYTYILTVVL